MTRPWARKGRAGLRTELSTPWLVGMENEGRLMGEETEVESQQFSWDPIGPTKHFELYSKEGEELPKGT